MLAEIADCEVVVGAVTKPWEANVTFRSIAAADFAAFNEPDTSRSPGRSGRTRSMPVQLDLPYGNACGRYRRRRAQQVPPILGVSVPGHFSDRQMMLRPVKTEAEQQAYLDMGPSDTRRVFVEAARKWLVANATGCLVMKALMSSW